MSRFRIIYLVIDPIRSIWVVKCFNVSDSATNLNENEVATHLALVISRVIKSHSEGCDNTCNWGCNSRSRQSSLWSIDFIDRYSYWQTTIFNRIGWPTASWLYPDDKGVLSSHTDCVADLISTSSLRRYSSTKFVEGTWQTHLEDIVLIDLKIAVDVPSENSVHFFHVNDSTSRVSWVVKMALCFVCRSRDHSKGIGCLLWVEGVIKC